MAQAAQTLTPVSLELGGKDPMIVLADADLERAANSAAILRAQQLGPGLHLGRADLRRGGRPRRVLRAADGQGPRRCARARPASRELGRRRRDHLRPADRADRLPRPRRGRQGRDRRTRRRPRRGAGAGYYEPTVLTDVDHSMLCMTEETFGPTLPVMGVRDADEAVELANDGKYGLQASVWTRDDERGEQLARRIEAGTVMRERRAAQLRGARAADGRLEVVRARLAPRPRRDPQVHAAPVDAGHAGLRAVARGPPLPLQRRGQPGDGGGVRGAGQQRAVRRRAARDPASRSATPSSPRCRRPRATRTTAASGRARPRT